MIFNITKKHGTQISCEKIKSQRERERERNEKNVEESEE